MYGAKSYLTSLAVLCRTYCSVSEASNTALYDTSSYDLLMANNSNFFVATAVVVSCVCTAAELPPAIAGARGDGIAKIEAVQACFLTAFLTPRSVMAFWNMDHDFLRSFYGTPRSCP